jgi:hypothetical protein
MTFVVVRHRSGTARLHRQTWLGAVERLDLALFVDREDDRMGRRIDVKVSDVFELLSKPRVGRQLEHTDAMRRELVSLEDTLHRTQTYPRRLRQWSSARVTFTTIPALMSRA